MGGEGSGVDPVEASASGGIDFAGFGEKVTETNQSLF
jgi:hypothetical protein